MRQESLHRRIRRDIRENDILNGREAIVRLYNMSNPTAARKLLVGKIGDAIVGHCERDIRSIGNRRIGQVRIGSSQTAVGRATHMDGIDVALASASACVGRAGVDHSV